MMKKDAEWILPAFTILLVALAAFLAGYAIGDRNGDIGPYVSPTPQIPNSVPRPASHSVAQGEAGVR